MTWWLKARSVWGLVATVLVTNAIGVPAGNTRLPVPVLTGGSGDFIVGHLLPVLPAVALMYGMGRSDVRAERVAARPLRHWDTALALAAAALATVTAYLARILTGLDVTMVIARNTTAYIGIALLTAAFLGSRTAAVLTTLIPIALAATGWAPGGQPQRWAWILQPIDSTTALAMTVITLTAGFVAAVTFNRPS